MSSLTQFSFLHVADLGGQRIEQGQKKGSRESRLKQSLFDLPVRPPSGRPVSLLRLKERVRFSLTQLSQDPSIQGLHVKRHETESQTLGTPIGTCS